MKTITEIGYFHPSQANWSYRVHIITDETGSKLYRENFGGDERLVRTLAEKGVELVRNSVQFSGIFKGREVLKMPDVESYSGKNYTR